MSLQHIQIHPGSTVQELRSTKDITKIVCPTRMMVSGASMTGLNNQKLTQNKNLEMLYYFREKPIYFKADSQSVHYIRSKIRKNYILYACRIKSSTRQLFGGKYNVCAAVPPIRC